METTGPLPDGSRARAGLAAVSRSQDALRSLPWPWWLYTVNGAGLGAAALLPLLGSPEGSALLAVFIMGLCAFNYWAGSRMGAPFTLPRSRAFLACVALSAVLLASSILAAGSGLTGLVWCCAAGTVLSYAVGSVLHYRDTRR